MTTTTIEFEKVGDDYVCDLTKYSDAMAGVINLITSEPDQIVSVEAGAPGVFWGKERTKDAYTAPDDRSITSDTPATLRIGKLPSPLPRLAKAVVESIITSTGEFLKLTVIEQTEGTIEDTITVMADNYFSASGDCKYVPSLPKNTVLDFGKWERYPMVVQVLQTPYGKGLVFELDFPDGVGVTLRTSKPVKQAIWIS